MFFKEKKIKQNHFKIKFNKNRNKHFKICKYFFFISKLFLITKKK